MTDTLMDYLPPAGWSDLARRSDVDQLRLEMQAMESRMDAKLAGLRVALTDKLTSQTRWFIGSQLVLVVAFVSSITTIAH